MHCVFVSVFGYVSELYQISFLFWRFLSHTHTLTQTHIESAYPKAKKRNLPVRWETVRTVRNSAPASRRWQRNALDKNESCNEQSDSKMKSNKKKTISKTGEWNCHPQEKSPNEIIIKMESSGALANEKRWKRTSSKKCNLATHAIESRNVHNYSILWADERRRKLRFRRRKTDICSQKYFY